MGTRFGMALAKHACTVSLEALAGGGKIGDFVTDMMDAAGGILVEEVGDRRTQAQGLEQLDLGIGKIDEHHRHAVLRLRLGCGYARSQCLAIDTCGSFEVRNGDGDMIETTEHDLSGSGKRPCYQ